MTPDRAPLAGVSVLELGRGLGGRAAGTLLADLGAAVFAVADPGLGPREPDPHRATAYDRNKRSVSLGADRVATLHELVRRADVVVVDPAAGDTTDVALDEASLRTVHPGLVYCRVDGFGTGSPTPTPVATDRTVQAFSGCMDLTGHEGGPAYAMGLPLADLAAGIHAAIAVLAVVATGEPRAHGIEVARNDVAVSMLSYMAVGYFVDGVVPTRVGTGHSTIFPYNSFEARDGEVVVAPFTNRFWRNFCRGIAREDLLERAELRNFAGRLAHKEDLLTELSPVLATRTVDEWVEIFRVSDVPAGPVLDVAAALALPQTVERGMVRAVSGGTTRTVGSPMAFRFTDGVVYRPPVDPPPSRDDTAAALATPVRAAPVRAGAVHDGAGSGGAPPGAPLAGLRVLDLTRMFAGPCATEVLADLGADVIKVEEPRVGDPTRRNLPFFGSESAYFLSLNRGKRSVALDLKSGPDRDAAAALAATADVVVENYRPGVMDRLGLGAAALHARHPALVVCSLSGFGATGPLRDTISFDLVNQAMAGTIDLTGAPGERPARIGVPIGDMTGGFYTALAALAGVRAARRTGRGCHVDLALHDILVALLGADAQRHLDTGGTPTRVGNRDRDAAPVGSYRAADGWIVLDAGDDRSWSALVGVLGEPALSDDPRFTSAAGRKAAEDEIDRVLAARFGERTAAGWSAVLSRAGVPAAPVLTLAEALDTDVVRARDLVYPVDVPGAGVIRTLASPVRLDGRRLGHGASSPLLGADTDAVLGTAREEGPSWTCASSVAR